MSIHPWAGYGEAEMEIQALMMNGRVRRDPGLDGRQGGVEVRIWTLAVGEKAGTGGSRLTTGR